MKGHTRWRGKSVEVLVYRGNGRYLSRTVKWQGTKKATQNAADRKLRELLDELDEGQHQGDDTTVAQLVKRWRRQSEPDWSPATTAAYASYLRNHILPELGDLKLRQVKPDVVDDFYADLRSKQLSAASIGKVHVILRRAFAEAVRWRWITSNPITDARPPKIRRAELTPPSAAQVAQLLGLARKDVPLYTYLAVAADTGARRGEVCGLRWSNVDLESGELIIDRAIVIAKGGVVEKDTKTHQDRRVALGEPAVVALREHRKRCAERALHVGVSLAPNAYVFSSHADSMKPWRPDVVTARFGRLRERFCDCKDRENCRKAEHQAMRRVRLHDLRHALITDWLAAGVDARTVMGRVGHANLTTLTRYAHFVEAADKDAAKRLGDRHRAGSAPNVVAP